MTIQIKARDLALAALLIAVGVLIGLAFNAAPSRAQSVGSNSSYVAFDGQWFYCQGRDCIRVRYDTWS
jgi:hypothetical protein